MSISRTTRLSLCSSLSKRYISSKAKPPTLSLTPSKLRALISIYHQCAHFITPQNLSAAIDRAFIGDPDEIDSVTSKTKEMNSTDLTKTIRRRESQMTTGRWKRVQAGWTPDYLTGQWSEARKGREKRILAALYGTEETGQPGLEVLMEERARLVKNIEADRK
jgi:hypothetical protein